VPIDSPPIRFADGYVIVPCICAGHWIQACPTNENPEFEGKPRFKRTTGIPKSFLKTVEKPADGADSDDPNLGGASVMITGDGSFVTVQPDRQTWRKTTKPKPLTAGELLNLTSDGSSGAGGGLALPPHLTCPVCTRLLHTPSRTPCCKSLYCEECIHNHLLDNDFVCPSCESKISSLKGVKVDEEVKKQVDEFVDVEVERRKQERKAAGDDGDGEGSEDEVKAEVKGEEADENKVGNVSGDDKLSLKVR
jgi:protein MPE1